MHTANDVLAKEGVGVVGAGVFVGKGAVVEDAIIIGSG